jgi:uroporphyrinogen-III decarboxylase
VRAAGAQPACGFLLPGPLFEYFSIGRSMAQMSLDLYDRPEKIKAAGKVWAPAFARLAIRFAKLVGVPRVFIGLSRSSPAMISPKFFEEFVWPELELMVNLIIDAGLTPLLHCDTDWTKNFPFFARLPAKKIILELDGASDIFQAKEILGKRMCLMGDVPAYLLAFGSKDRVLDYCRRLIQAVGLDGGFILSSGCSIPANAKAENVRALVEAVEEWGYY